MPNQVRPQLHAAYPTLKTREYLSLMQMAGVTAVTEKDGWTYLANGKAIIDTAPAPCTAPGCPQPGNGNPMNYPVIGTVVANNTVFIGSVNAALNAYGTQTASYNGLNGPATPYYGIPQVGFGARYQWDGPKVFDCSIQIGVAANQLRSIAVQIAQHAGNFTPTAVQAVKNWLIAYGEAAPGIVAGAEFIGGLFAFLATPEVLLALSLAGLTWAVTGIIFKCYSSAP